MSLAVVRDLREARLPAGPDELLAFETDVLAGFVLARAAAGLSDKVDPAALGYPVTAFITLEIRQAGGHDPVAERLAAIPEVLEVHTITGASDMLCRVVARGNADLQRILDAIVSMRAWSVPPP